MRILMLLLIVLLGAGTALGQADPRTEARALAEQGRRQYDAGDFHGAITSFQRAEQLAPAAGNDLNLALCYDKLGLAANAINSYKSYLVRAPAAPNKVAVEASIARLENAVRAAEAKAAAAAEAARQAEAAQKAEAEKKAEAARQAEAAQRAEAARQAEEARRAEEARQRAASMQAFDPYATDAPSTSAGASGGYPTATGPSASSTAPSGAALADIDIGAVAASRQLPAARPLPPQARSTGYASLEPQRSDSGNSGPPAPADPSPKSKPFYKSPLFWGVAIVGTIALVYVLTPEDSDVYYARRSTSPLPTPAPALIRW